MNNVLNSPENNEEINFMDSFADELIDKKVKMGMGFHELNELFNNKLEKHYDNRFNEEFTGAFVYKDEFLPYFESGYGEIYFYIKEEYGLCYYRISIYKEDDIIYNEFIEYRTRLDEKYGEGARDNFNHYYWIKNENKLPLDIVIVESFLNGMGGVYRIDISYTSKNNAKKNIDWLSAVVKGILEVRAGIPDCCTRAAMRGI
jgi:hypothetical protein